MTVDQDAAIAYPTTPYSGELTGALPVVMQNGRMQLTGLDVLALALGQQQGLADSLETLTVPRIGVLEEPVAAASFTDGGVATGTLAMTGALPAGAVVVGSKVLVSAGFAGNVSATLTIGDGSDADRFNTGTPSIFATAETGIVSGPPSGNPLILTAVSPVLTVVSATDFTLVLAGGGVMSVAIYYIVTV